MSKYKVGDKVVLTVSDVNEKVYYPHYEFNNNFNLWKQSVDDYAEPLSTYTKPLEDKIKKLMEENIRLIAENTKLKAKDDVLKTSCDDYEEKVNDMCDTARAEGQDEAWELARKIILPPSKGGMSSDDYIAIFGNCISESYVMKNYTYAEAAAKVAEWEKAKEEIKVGDVVSHEEKYGVVISEGTICFRGFTDDGTPFEWYKERCTKTGRHIDIDIFLKQISGEEK